MDTQEIVAIIMMMKKHEEKGKYKQSVILIYKI